MSIVENLRIDNEEFVIAPDLQPCWNCGELTHLVEINYEARLCSVGCVKEKDKEFIRAWRKSYRR